MIPSVRKIIENSNQELQEKTEQEMINIKNGYQIYPVKKVIEEIDVCLKKRELRYVDEIQNILKNSPNETRMNYELQVLKKVFASPVYPNTSFSEINSSMDIFKLYRVVFLLLKRIEFGFIQDKNSYLKMVCEEYRLKPIDFSLVLDSN